MNQAYNAVVSLFYQLSNAFFWPVAIALLILFGYSLMDLGSLLYAAFLRRREPRVNLRRLSQSISSRLERGASGRLDDGSLTSSLRRFWGHVDERLREMEDTGDLDMWLDEVLRREEMQIANQLDRSRALVRIGPMLGLAGTIIPLGPALQSLLGGDMGGMVNHLVVGFGAVVCGLVLSGIAYYTTLIRERWARADIKEMEDLSELLMRAVQRRQAVNGEARYASVRPS